MNEAARRKQAAAEAAVERHVRSGMALGLGTGTTAGFVLEALAERLADGRLRELRGVPSSARTAARAGELGIPLATLDELPALDLALDGADEIAPNLDLVKGAGGAQLHEKVVASAAAIFVVVADESKLVSRLGERAPLPVEVIPFARAVCERRLRDQGWRPELRRRDGDPWLTDEGNNVFDCRRDDWTRPEALEHSLRSIPGVVEHGLFLGMARSALVGTAAGVRELHPAR